MAESTQTAAVASVRAGVDLVAVSDVADSMTKFGDRYLNRIYSPRERADCQGQAGVSAASLAARFAAKEAVRKVLRAPGHQPPWTDIEILRASWGGCLVRLSGRATADAAAEGISSWSVSLSHEGDMAVAVVVAACASAKGEELWTS